MNKPLWMGVGIGIAVATMIGAVASFRGNEAAVATPAAIPADAAVDQMVSAEPDAPAPAVQPNAEQPDAVAPDAVEKAPVSTPSRSADESFAVVLASSPVLASDKVAREECKDVQVTRQKPIKDEDKIAGTAIGAVVGGVIGNQIGGGDGKKIATVAGAVAGGFAGRKVQERIQDKNTELVTEKQCQTVYDTRERAAGFSVKYRLNGQVRTVNMKTDPGVGTRIPADDKRLAS